VSSFPSEFGRIPAKAASGPGGDRAIRSNFFCRLAAKKDFRFYPLREDPCVKIFFQ
jgi:hypothetical protein